MLDAVIKLYGLPCVISSIDKFQFWINDESGNLERRIEVEFKLRCDRPMQLNQEARDIVSTMSSESPKPIRDRWALLVGINQYADQDITDLRFCVNDVQALEKLLRMLGYRVVCLHDQVNKSNLLPTYKNVVEQLKAICQNPMIGPDDLLLVHFACHGTLVERQPHLIMQDTGYETMTQTALPVAEVEAEMRNSGATRLVLTLDACHAGVELREPVPDAVDRNPGTQAPADRKIVYEPGFIQRVYDSAQGFVLIAASAAQQTALELNGKQHGLFTYFMLEGLSRTADRAEKGFVTVSDLIAHVTDTVQKLTEEGKQVQEPTYRIDGKGDMILADYREVIASRVEMQRQDSATQTPGRQNRLKAKHEELQQEWERLNNQIKRLRKQQLLETRVEEQDRLEDIIKGKEIFLNELEEEIDGIEKELETE